MIPIRQRRKKREKRVENAEGEPKPAFGEIRRLAILAIPPGRDGTLRTYARAGVTVSGCCNRNSSTVSLGTFTCSPLVRT